MKRFPYTSLPVDDPKVYDAVRYLLDGGSQAWVANRLNVDTRWVQQAWRLWRESLDHTPYRTLNEAEIKNQSATFIPKLISASERAREASARKRKPPGRSGRIMEKLNQLLGLQVQR